MGLFCRNAASTLAPEVLSVSAAVGTFGVAYGILVARTTDVPTWLAPLSSLLVFAGSAQFVFVGAIAGSASSTAALLAALLANTRYLALSAAMGPHLGRLPAMLRILASHWISDESVALALSHPNPADARRTYWLAGLSVFFAWNVGTVLGAVGSFVIEDPSAFGLDMVFPATFLALLAPQVRTARHGVLSGLGALVFFGTTPWLPQGIPILLASGAVLLVLPFRRMRPDPNFGTPLQSDKDSEEQQ